MKKYLLGILTFAFAFVVLSVSVFRSASPRYAFTASLSATVLAAESGEVTIDYELAYPGGILPDSPLWPLKALRDKLWQLLTIDSSKASELSLLCSDKRLGMSKILFERKKPELAFSTLGKGEKYLEEAFNHEKKAREKGEDTSDLLTKISKSSLKHRLVIEEILAIAPEDARPEIIKIQDYSKNIYKEASEVLNSKGVTPPINPFDGE